MAQHYSVYRAQAYGLADDDYDFFEWRKADRVTIGHNVRIGHGVTITARVIKRRFPAVQAKALQEIAV